MMCIILGLPRELQEKVFDYLTSGTRRGGVYIELAGFAASSKDSAGIVSRYVISRTPSRARFSLLHKASRIGCLPVVHEILFEARERPETVNARDEFGNTPLHCASAGGQRHVVAHLLDHPHVDVNASNENGETPLNFMLSSDSRTGLDGHGEFAPGERRGGRERPGRRREHQRKRSGMVGHARPALSRARRARHQCAEQRGQEAPSGGHQEGRI